MSMSNLGLVEKPHSRYIRSLCNYMASGEGPCCDCLSEVAVYQSVYFNMI